MDEVGQEDRIHGEQPVGHKPRIPAQELVIQIVYDGHDGATPAPHGCQEGLPCCKLQDGKRKGTTRVAPQSGLALRERGKNEERRNLLQEITENRY